MNICLCGCLQECKNKYCKGHWARVNNPMLKEETRQKLRKSKPEGFGVKISGKNNGMNKEGIKNKHKHIMKEVNSRPENKEKNSISQKVSWLNEDIRKRRIIGIQKTKSSEEQVEKQRLRVTGDKNPGWIGGCNDYWHNVARKLYKTDVCQKCGILESKQIENFGVGFSMHCTSIPKDYTIMKEYNWMTVCSSCHPKVENKQRISNG